MPSSFGQNVAPIQAAAVQVESRKILSRSRKTGDITSDPVEARMWTYWQNLGEVKFWTSVFSNTARLVSYYPATPSNDNEEASEPEASTNSRVVQVWDQIGGEAQIAQWVSELVVHYLIAGQAWMAATLDNEDGSRRLADPDDTDAIWRVLSTPDLRAAAGLDEMAAIPVGDVRFWRLYTPSIHKQSEADSPLRHVDADCELLSIYKQRLRADSWSRMSAGIWALPARLQNERLDNGQTWADQLEQDITAPIRNPRSTAAVVPLIAWLEKDEAEMLSKGPIRPSADSTEDILARIESARRSLAIGLDAPPELILGLGDLNHWTGWLVQRSSYEQHLDPLLVRILNDLTPWFRSVLEASGVSEPDIMLWRNPDSAIASPNVWDQAVQLHDRYAISDESLRRAADIGEADAPDDEELKRRILTRALASPLALSAVPGLTEGSELAPGGVVDPSTGEPPASDNPAESNDMPEPVIQAATNSQLERLARRLARIDQTLLVAVEQAASREAARLQRNLNQRIAAAARKAGESDVEEGRIAERLGEAAVLALLATTLLVDPSEVRTDKIEAAIQEAQQQTDRALATVEAQPPGTRDDDRALATTAIAATVASAVAASVFKRTKPQGESSVDGSDIVPVADVRTALDRAGGGLASRTADGEEAWELIGNGRHTVTALDRVGVKTQAFRWVYGTAPRQSFEPHLNLDGEVFDRWDADVLAQEGTGGEWIGGTHFHPGDHRGDRCTYERVLVEKEGLLLVASGDAKT